MQFEIDKDTAEILVSVINEWAENSSLIRCIGNKAIIFKCEQLEEALKNWEED